MESLPRKVGLLTATLLKMRILRFFLEVRTILIHRHLLIVAAVVADVAVGLKVHVVAEVEGAVLGMGVGVGE